MEPSRYSNGGSGKTLDQITAPHLHAVAYARDTIQAMKSALAPGLLKFSGFPFQDKSLPLSSKKYVCHFFSDRHKASNNSRSKVKNAGNHYIFPVQESLSPTISLNSHINYVIEKQICLIIECYSIIAVRQVIV